ncbi:Transposase IS200 like protein [Candidatus Brocadiaceae bacterium S225]|nr:Transposase IS200 like protein [Candidatus Brocadiaceae bacterium S225]
MKLKHGRRSIRLKGYDYSQAGAYFVTVCVQGRRCLLGNVDDNGVVLSTIGAFVYQCLGQIPDRFETVELDEFVIMPNHVHAILIFDVGARFIVPYKRGFDKSNPYIRNNPMLLNSDTLGKVMRSFKAKATHMIRNVGNCSYFQWQRNYYEHIVRNEDSLNRIREYIIHNPMRRQFDRENPDYIHDNGGNYKMDQIEEMIYGKQHVGNS